MVVPTGSMSRGEVQIIPFTITSGTTAKIDVTPGAYDIMIIHSAGIANMYTDIYTDAAQSGYCSAYMQLPNAVSEESGVLGLIAVTNTPSCVLVVPRGSVYTPTMVFHGFGVRYSSSSNYSGSVVCRRR